MDRPSPWFRWYRPIPHCRLRLVCFPHAGGSASAYRSWPRHLPADVEVLAVQYPGRQDRLREPLPDSLEDLAEAVTDALTPFLDRPVALFGHSMGASVAHEVAMRLRQVDDAIVTMLFVSSRMPPKHHQPRELHLDDETLLADVRELDGANSAILDDPEMRQLFLPAIRADYRLSDAHRPTLEAALHVPVVGYVSDADPYVSPWQMAAWSEVTTAGFELVEFPGDHFYLRSQEAQLVADLIRRLDAGRPVRR